MSLARLFIIFYVITEMIFLFIPKRAFHNFIRKYMNKNFKPEDKSLVYRIQMRSYVIIS
jgi:hypothetical protein